MAARYSGDNCTTVTAIPIYSSSSLAVSFAYDTTACGSPTPLSPNTLSGTNLLLVAILVPVAALIIIAIIVVLVVPQVRKVVLPFRDRERVTVGAKKDSS